MLSTSSPSNAFPTDYKPIAFEQLPSLARHRPSQFLYSPNNQPYDMKSSLNMQRVQPPPTLRDQQKRNSIVQAPLSGVAWPGNIDSIVTNPKNAYGFGIDHSPPAKNPLTLGNQKPTYNVSLAASVMSPTLNKNKSESGVPSLTGSFVLDSKAQQSSPMHTGRTNNLQLYLPPSYTGRPRGNSEYEIEDSLKQGPTKEIYQRTAKLLLSTSGDTLPTLYQNNSTTNVPSSSKLLSVNLNFGSPNRHAGNKSNVSIESLENSRTEQSPVRTKVINQQENSEELQLPALVNGIPDTRLRVNSLQGSSVSASESNRELKTVFKRQIKFSSQSIVDSNQRISKNLISMKEQMPTKKDAYDLFAGRTQRVWKTQIVESSNTSNPAVREHKGSLEIKSPLLSPIKPERENSEPKMLYLPDPTKMKSKSILRQSRVSRVGISTDEVGEETSQSPRRVTFVLKDEKELKELRENLKEVKGTYDDISSDDDDDDEDSNTSR